MASRAPWLAVVVLLWACLAATIALAEDPPQPSPPPSAPAEATSPPADQPSPPPSEQSPPPATQQAPPPAPEPPKAGELTELQGEVRAKRGSEPTRPLAKGAPVYVTDILATGPSDKGKVVFTDDSSLEIGPDSQLAVADFAYDPANADTSRQAIRLAKGLFRYASGKVVEQDPARLRIESPLAVIGIRGTTTDHKIVVEKKMVKGAMVEEVKDELHSLRATKKTTSVVVDQQGMKSVLTKTDQAAFLRPKLPGVVRALTDKEKKEFANIPLTPAPFDPRPGSGLTGGTN